MKTDLSRFQLACSLLAGTALLAVGCQSNPPPPPQTCTPGCNGSVLTTCDSKANATTTDCSAQKDGKGKPMTCTYLTDQQTFDCIGDYNGGCGSETIDGRCDGSTLIYCLSEDSGDASDSGGTAVNVVSVDCTKDPTGLTSCAVAADGTANCAKPGTKGCGSVSSDGVCDGDTLSQCVNGALQTTDCTASGSKCGLADVGPGYACIKSSFYKTGAGNPLMAVSGTFVYEKKTVDTTSMATAANGFTANPVLTPVRRALVQLLAAADNSEIQRTFTDDTGAFTLYLTDVTVPAYVQVSASADPTLYPLAVRDCPPSATNTYPSGCTDKVGNVYQFKTAQFTGPKSFGQTTLTEASGLAGAFNIFNYILKGQEFARINLNGGAYPATPPVLVEWKKGYQTVTSYCAGVRGIVIQGNGTGGDTDEFDDPVLMHEFGHFLEAAFSVSDSPGGSHDGSPTDPRLAWGEGYGTYVGCRIAGSSLYFDTTASGASVTDLNNTGVKASANDALGIKQLMSEYVTGEILWRIDLGTGGNTTGVGATGGQGSAPIFDVLGGYFKNNPKYNDNHGVSGRELVKFLDGWSCRDFQGKAAASTSVLQQVVTTDHGFPYDDYGHMISAIGTCK
jgi:hypothetical protein